MAPLAYAAPGDFIFSFDGSDGAGETFSFATELVVDSNDRIIVANSTGTGPALIQIYDSSGTFIDSFDGGDTAGGTDFVQIRGLAVDSNNRIIVGDFTLDTVQIFDSSGTFVDSFDGSDSDTAFNQIQAVAVDANDRIFVGNQSGTSPALIKIFDSTGSFTGISFDGSDGGTVFSVPEGMAIDSNNRLIVTDNGAPVNVQIYTLTGTFIDSFDGDEDGGTAWDEPVAVAFDDADRIIIADDNDSNVEVYDSTGSFLVALSGGITFSEARGVGVDSNNRIYVIDEQLGIVQVYEGFPLQRTSGGGSADGFKTRPTFGLDHNSFRALVDGGFSFNGKSHDITDNWWTPFAEQKVKIGSTNSFTAKAYADKQLRIQEFLFGIPSIGDAHNAELGIEVVYDYSGEIDRINVVQKTDIIDIDSIKVKHSKSTCQSDDTVKRCDTTRLSMKFLEPLKDKIMAIKAIDFKGRVHITYLNEGFDISGNSLNPMNTMMIPSTEKYEGLIEVTQTAKYSSIWTAQDDREFEMNTSGSFAQINQSFERHIDTGVMKNRLHSEFYTLKQSQADLASSIMPAYYRTSINYEESFSEINDIFAYEYPEPFESKLDNPEIQKRMIIQAEKAQKIMEYLLDPASYRK